MLGPLWLLLSASVAMASEPSHVRDCKDQCDAYYVVSEFEDCLRECTHYMDLSALPPLGPNLEPTAYPSPPTNVRLEIWAEVEGGRRKRLRLTLHWEAPEEKERTAFYLSITAKGARCEELFPGFYSHSLGASLRSFAVPARTLQHMDLTLAHGCSYRLEMHSVPYIYGEPDHSALLLFTVPDCVQGLCDCHKRSLVAAPADVSVADEGGGPELRWTFAFPDAERPQPLRFWAQLGDLVRNASQAPWRNVFAWRRDLNLSLPAVWGSPSYALPLPRLTQGALHRVGLFATDAHLCRSRTVFEEFRLKGGPSNEAAATAASVEGKFPSSTTATSAATEASSEDTAAQEEARSRLATDWAAPWAVALGGLAGAALLVLALCCALRRLGAKEKPKAPAIVSAGSGASGWKGLGVGRRLERNVVYTEAEVAVARAQGRADRLEIAYGRLTFGRVLGRGAFGCVVYLGTAEGLGGEATAATVALKQLSTSATEEELVAFRNEMEVMKAVGGQSNIVSLLGVATLGPAPPVMVMEFLPYGDLLRYLRNLRRHFESLSTTEKDYVGGGRDLSASFHQGLAGDALTGPLHGKEPLSRSLHQDDLRRALQSPSLASSAATLRSGSLSGSAWLQREALGDEACSLHKDADAAASLHSAMSVSGREAFADARCTVGAIPFADDGRPELPASLPHSLHPDEIHSFALQIARGMEHVEALGITHRDLAARNILLGRGKVLKISDFGLSRSGVYVKNTSGRIPLRWLSPEAIRDNVYSPASDVWAYGVLLWEIATLGGFPYAGVEDGAVAGLVEAGRRLERPAAASDELQSLMQRCWSPRPSERPTFRGVAELLSRTPPEDHQPYVLFAPGTQGLPPPQEL